MADQPRDERGRFASAGGAAGLSAWAGRSTRQTLIPTAKLPPPSDVSDNELSRRLEDHLRHIRHIQQEIDRRRAA